MVASCVDTRPSMVTRTMAAAYSKATCGGSSMSLMESNAASHGCVFPQRLVQAGERLQATHCMEATGRV